MAPSSASPQHDRLAYMPALDGVRSMAVAAVLLYHGDVSWARGGCLGVDAFFVLSGFLITSLLLAEWRGDGRFVLSAFWARRARRLLPAVAAYGAVIAAPAELEHLRSDGLSTLGYVANWGQIFSHQSYFESFAAPSPLRHTWSLAIEEQFYLVWPLLVAGVLRWRLDSIARSGGRRAAGGIGGVDDRALQAGRRPDARLLRDRHTRAVAADGALLAMLLARLAVRWVRTPRAPFTVARCWQRSGWDGSGCTRPRRPAGAIAAASRCARCSSR